MATKEGFVVVVMQAADEGVAVATLSGTPEIEGKLEEKPTEEEKKSSPPLDKRVSLTGTRTCQRYTRLLEEYLSLSRQDIASLVPD